MSFKAFVNAYENLLRLDATSFGRFVSIAALRSGGSALSTKFSLEQNDASHCGCDDYRLTLRRILWRNNFANRAPVAVVYDGGGVYLGGASSGLVKSMTHNIFPVTTINAIRANGPSSTIIVPNDLRPLHNIEKTLIQKCLPQVAIT
ncbi:hypothetical protein GQX74_005389 [Glossina fuscipes]|nr:hypothetical protein GQX74_005389 [Glossina fuscipes]